MNMEFVCPRCHDNLEFHTDNVLFCKRDGLQFKNQDGIWEFLLPERVNHFNQFIREYQTIRHAEGRFSNDPEFYRGLPFDNSGGKKEKDWRIRAASYKVLLEKVILPFEFGLPLNILDLGAGTGWLSNRLAARGHHLVAVDLLVNDWDGLGAYKHYQNKFTLVQAEFEKLPFQIDQFDIVIFNASFHYAEDYMRSMDTALKVIRASGHIVILDTPIYHSAKSGVSMVAEREAIFQAKYGFPSNALDSVNFLTFSQISTVAKELGLQFSINKSNYSLFWFMRPLLAKISGNREPAKFAICDFYFE